MDEREDDNGVAGQLVEHDVLVEGQEVHEGRVPQERQAFPQHEDQDEGTVEVEAHPGASGYDDVPEGRQTEKVTCRQEREGGREREREREYHYINGCSDASHYIKTYVLFLSFFFFISLCIKKNFLLFCFGVCVCVYVCVCVRVPVVFVTG